MNAVKASKAIVRARVFDVLRLLIDGGDFGRVLEYVRENEILPHTNWTVDAGEKPLSVSAVR